MIDVIKALIEGLVLIHKPENWRWAVLLYGITIGMPLLAIIEIYGDYWKEKIKHGIKKLKISSNIKNDTTKSKH